jgi:S1-C subfamily serine protease
LHRFPPGSGGDNSCPHATEHTPEYCNGYQIGYTTSWNRLNQGPSSPATPTSTPAPRVSPPSGTITSLNDSNILTLQSLALNRIFNNTQGSVVQISHSIPGNQSVYYGSGFIYNQQGYIVTNNHVVNGTNTVNVTFTDGNVYTENVIGTDPFNDIAVIKIVDDFSSENIIPLVLGNSSNVKVGQLAIAIGNPLGLTDSMTMGIISQIGRLFPAAELPGGLGGFAEADIIQTDALINPGNSGGPLLDIQGQVIGMNTFTRTERGLPTGIGFGIPSNSIQHIVPALIQYGSYSHPWLGL